MRGAIIAGGNDVSKSVLLRAIEGCEYIICADSGFDRALAQGIMPNAVIGDMDSVHSALPDNLQIIKLSPEKDMTDTRAAIDFALDTGCTEIVLVCALGSRFDHSLANIGQLVYLHGRGCSGKIIDDNNIIRLLCGRGEIAVNRDGEYKLSLIPFGGDVFGISTEGLKYPLMQEDLPLGSDRGVSNGFAAEIAKICIQSGMLLVIMSKD